MQTNDTSKMLLQMLEGQVRQTRAAYYAAMPGVTYDDMSAAAKRLLEMRASFEKASGRKVTTRVTKKSVATLLRAL